MTEIKSSAEVTDYKEPGVEIPSWNQKLDWNYLAGRKIAMIYPDEGKLELDRSEKIYLGQFGALVFLNKSPCNTQISCDLTKFEDESGEFREIYINEVFASFPPRKIGGDGREKIDYQKLNAASVATLYSYPETFVIPHRYVIKANLLDAPATILIKHVQ